MKPVSRKEDMSPNGQLKISFDDDGDIYVTVFSDDGGGVIDNMATVEFCTCGIGGGQSQKTRAALIELAKAMDEDNKSKPSRAGYL